MAEMGQLRAYSARELPAGSEPSVTPPVIGSRAPKAAVRATATAPTQSTLSGHSTSPPFITIALDLLPGFTPFDISGPIHAFDAPVQPYFYPWRDNGLWETINHALMMLVREAEGPHPPAAYWSARSSTPPTSRTVTDRERPRLADDHRVKLLSRRLAQV